MTPPSSSKELLGLTSVTSMLMRMDALSLALALASPIITWVLAPFSARLLLSLVYLTWRFIRAYITEGGQKMTAVMSETIILFRAIYSTTRQHAASMHTTLMKQFHRDSVTKVQNDEQAI
jgi:hypothetical protein